MTSTLHSFVVPVFNEEQVLPEFAKRFEEAVARKIREAGEEYELVFVNDGSRDASWRILGDLRASQPDRIKLISLSRNFGHQIAITAGIDLATGDTVSVLDADLQDPPEVILKMIEMWKQGFDIVYGVREKRERESFFKRVTALLFYRALRSSTQLDIPLDAGDFRLMSRRSADALRSMRERHRFIRGMTSWIGFKQAQVLYVRHPRFAGETKYPFKKMVRLAWDAFTGFSVVPLKFAAYLGAFSATLALVASVWALYLRLFTDRSVQGWTSLIIAVLFLGGVQLLTIGVLGEYIGRIFDEAKGRPLYLIESAIGFKAPGA